MIVNTTLEPHVVDYYDLLFSSGFLLPITIDRDAGDTVDFDSDPLIVKFTIAAKASTMDPDVKTDPEEITVFVQHLITISHRRREIMPPTPEQQETIRQFIHKLHPTKQ